MEHEIIVVETTIGAGGVYLMKLDSVSYKLMTHAMDTYQKHLEAASRYADKKRGDVPKKATFKGRPRIIFTLNGVPGSPSASSTLSPAGSSSGSGSD